MRVPEQTFSERALDPNFLHTSHSYTFESGLPDLGRFTLDYTGGDKLIKVCYSPNTFDPPARTRGIHYPYQEQMVKKNPYILLVETRIGQADGHIADGDSWPIFLVNGTEPIAEILHIQHSSTLKREGETVGFVQNGIMNRGVLGAIDLDADGIVRESHVYKQLPATMSDKNKGRFYRSLILATWAVECFKPAGV